MADRVQGKISFTPIVTLADDVDANGRDTIQHDINEALGAPMVVTARNAADKWYYAPNVIVTSTSAGLLVDAGDGLSALVGSSGNQDNPNEDVDSTVMFTDGETIHEEADRMRWIFIKNTGTADIYGTPTTDSVYVRIGSSAAYNSIDGMEIPEGEVWMDRLNTGHTRPNDLHVVTGLTKNAGSGTTEVRCTVVAMIDDISA